MEAPKNKQQTVMGDTATEDVTDVAPYMVAEKVTKVPSVKMGGSAPIPGGIKTPGNPSM